MDFPLKDYRIAIACRCRRPGGSHFYAPPPVSRKTFLQQHVTGHMAQRIRERLALTGMSAGREPPAQGWTIVAQTQQQLRAVGAGTGQSQIQRNLRKVDAGLRERLGR